MKIEANNLSISSVNNKDFNSLTVNENAKQELFINLLEKISSEGQENMQLDEEEEVSHEELAYSEFNEMSYLIEKDNSNLILRESDLSVNGFEEIKEKLSNLNNIILSDNEKYISQGKAVNVEEDLSNNARSPNYLEKKNVKLSELVENQSFNKQNILADNLSSSIDIQSSENTEFANLTSLMNSYNNAFNLRSKDQIQQNIEMANPLSSFNFADQATKIASNLSEQIDINLNVSNDERNFEHLETNQNFPISGQLANNKILPLSETINSQSYLEEVVNSYESDEDNATEEEITESNYDLDFNAESKLVTQKQSVLKKINYSKNFKTDLLEEIRNNYRFNNNKLVIELNPESMGKIQINYESKLINAEETVLVNIEVDNQDTFDLLNLNLDDLNLRLKEINKNVNLENSSIELNLNLNHNSQQQNNFKNEHEVQEEVLKLNRVLVSGVLKDSPIIGSNDSYNPELMIDIKI